MSFWETYAKTIVIFCQQLRDHVALIGSTPLCLTSQLTLTLSWISNANQIPEINLILPAPVEHKAASVEHKAAPVEHQAAPVEDKAAPVEHIAAPGEQIEARLKHNWESLWSIKKPLWIMKQPVEHRAAPKG